jgi:hypothetical protein
MDVDGIDLRIVFHYDVLLKVLLLGLSCIFIAWGRIWVILWFEILICIVTSLLRVIGLDRL